MVGKDKTMVDVLLELGTMKKWSQWMTMRNLAFSRQLLLLKEMMHEHSLHSRKMNMNRIGCL